MGLIGEQLDPNGKCICGGSVLVKAMNNIRLESIFIFEAGFDRRE